MKKSNTLKWQVLARICETLVVILAFIPILTIEYAPDHLFTYLLYTGPCFAGVKFFYQLADVFVVKAKKSTKQIRRNAEAYDAEFVQSI